MYDELWYCEALQRYALWRDGALWRVDALAPAGSIWRAKVIRRAPTLGGAFVDCGDFRALLACGNEPIPAEGSVVLVAESEPAVGDKLAVCKLHPTLAGEWVVYCPDGEGVHFSRQLPPAEREALRAVLPADWQGIVVRSESTAADAEALVQEAQALRERWKSWQHAQELGVVYTPVVRPQDYAKWARTVRTDCAAFPAGATRNVVYDEALVAKWQQTVEPQLARLGEPRVELPEGVWLMVEHTEACWVVDVNSGGYMPQADREASAYAVNCLAAKEVVRQLCLRNVRGVVLVDFVSMGAKWRQRFWEQLGEEAAADERLHLVDITPLWLVEMTRSAR